MNAKEVDGRINRALNAVRNAFRAIITRTKTTGDTAKVQIDALAGEIGQDMELAQHFGFTSHPPVGSTAIVLPLGGQTSHSIIIATENGAYRVQALKEGEVAIYNQDGAKTVFKKGRVIETDCDDYIVNCKNFKVNASSKSSFDTPNLETSKLLTAQGTINGNMGLAIKGTTESGFAATFTGTVEHIGGNFRSNGVVVHLHKHYDSLGGTTGLPV